MAVNTIGSAYPNHGYEATAMDRLWVLAHKCSGIGSTYIEFMETKIKNIQFIISIGDGETLKTVLQLSVNWETELFDI